MATLHGDLDFKHGEGEGSWEGLGGSHESTAVFDILSSGLEEVGSGGN